MTKRASFPSLVSLIALGLLLSGCGTESQVPEVQVTPSPTALKEEVTVITPVHHPDTPPLFRADATAEVTQELNFGEANQTRPGSPDTPFVTAGRQLYVIGDIDSGFRPRSNAYDLATYGGPRADDPLGGELGGVWAQPVKALDGYVFVVEAGGERWPMLDAHRFTQTFADVQFHYRKGPLTATRRDFVPQDRPALFTTLILRNDGDEPVDTRVAFYAYFDLEDAWRTTLADVRNSGETVLPADDRLVARALSAPDAWAVAIGGETPPESIRVTSAPDGQPVGKLEYTASLEPGTEQSWTFCIVVEAESGPEAALQHVDEWLPQHATLLAEKQALYRTLLTTGPRFHTPDAGIDAAFDIARANVQMLEGESPALGRYFYAGLETFPYWFSNDLAYGAGGLTSTGFGPTVAAHLRTGATQALGFGGQIPHQLSPAGSLIAPGNVQEMPQFVSAVWDYYRWTDDSAFLAEVYPALVQGVFDYNLGRADRDGDSYPEGAAMVERTGMGPEKLDAACYLWDALGDLAEMAGVLDDTETATRARATADDLRARFDSDWWLPEEEVYANSLLRYKDKPRHDGHWTVAVPLEVGIASAEHGRTSLARIKRDYLNEWGLVHTLGDDERVWTLPTGVLSRGGYRYGDPDLGFDLLTLLAATLDHGAIGCYHELIPDGLTFLQNWSATMFLKGAVEDLMGLDPRADQHKVTIAPQLPAAWEFAELRSVPIGGHRLDVRAEREGAEIRHLSGPAPLTVCYGLLDVGPLTATLDGEPLDVQTKEYIGRDATFVEITLSPGETVKLTRDDDILQAIMQR
ncbi:MAG: glycosyl hydrolase family 65 protein [Chloroflexota bacterium]